MENGTEFGDDPHHEVDMKLHKRFEEARMAGLSPQCGTYLKKLLIKNRRNSKQRLGMGEAANFIPMKISLINGNRPIRVRVRCHPFDQQAFLDEYISKLVRSGFLERDATVTWQRALHLVLKGDSMWSVTIDLKPVNAATANKIWPMPSLEAGILDFPGRSHFGLLDLCSSYWQLPFDTKSSDACGIIAPQGSFRSTRIQHGLKALPLTFSQQFLLRL